ncbi:MAG: type II secretion system F family protein [Candidatus Nomurabacteria bacterium]|nr:type II secretion system F family protein [Candidatus Nomurabacteria bacterium]
MSIYLYEAYNKNNEIIKGNYEASSKEEIVEYLSKRYLIPISIEDISKNVKNKGLLSIDLFSSIGSTDIMFLVRNLATTIKAGLSIVESLDILKKDTKNKLMQKILEKSQAMVINGQSFSSSFGEYKNLFPPIFFGMIKAGEVSGNLSKKLGELAVYFSKENTLRNRVKSALTYPIILLIASTIVVSLMLIFVLPKLATSFIASNIQLPLITRFFLAVSKILTWSFTADLIVIGLLIWFFTYFRTTKIGKKFFFYIISHLPVADDLIKKIALVRFSRTFGSLIGSGLSVIEALSISAESIDNHNYTIAIEKTIEDIKNGIPISVALGKFPKLFPNLLISLITVGEKTGSLEEILITFSDFYDEEVDNKLKELASILEPVLLLIMGFMIGAIAISIIVPIYQLVGHFV